MAKKTEMTGTEGPDHKVVTRDTSAHDAAENALRTWYNDERNALLAKIDELDVEKNKRLAELNEGS